MVDELRSVKHYASGLLRGLCDDADGSELASQQFSRSSDAPVVAVIPARRCFSRTHFRRSNRRHLPHFERQVTAGNRRPAVESDAGRGWLAWEKALQRAQMVAGSRLHV